MTGMVSKMTSVSRDWQLKNVAFVIDQRRALGKDETGNLNRLV